MKYWVLLLSLFVAGCGTAPPAPSKPDDGPLTGTLLTEYAPRMASGLSKPTYDDDARTIIENPEQVTLYSVKPADFRKYGYNSGTKNPLTVTRLLEHLASGEGVLGSLVLKDREQLGELVGRMYRGFFDVDKVAGCFDPRHALVFRRGDAEVAALICFKCHYLVAFNADHSGRRRGFIGTQLKTLLNDILRAAEIPVAR